MIIETEQERPSVKCGAGIACDTCQHQGRVPVDWNIDWGEEAKEKKVCLFAPVAPEMLPNGGIDGCYFRQPTFVQSIRDGLENLKSMVLDAGRFALQNPFVF